MRDAIGEGPVVVVGPADLVTTAVVAALSGHGIDVRRVDDAPGTRRAGRSCIAIVDVSLEHAMRVVGTAIADGWRVVVLSADEQAPRLAAAVAQGASAWLSTRSPVAELVEIVRRVRAGDAVLGDDDREAWRQLHDRNVAETEERVAALDSLTDREFGVLRGLERGQRAGEIAQRNVVAITTVRTQIRSILQKLGVNSQDAAVELYRAALQARLDR